MSSEKPSPSVAWILGTIALISAIAGPAIGYGTTQGSKSAEIGAIRERTAVLEGQVSALQAEMKALTRELTQQVGAINVAVGRMEVSVNRLVDEEKTSRTFAGEQSGAKH